MLTGLLAVDGIRRLCCGRMVTVAGNGHRAMGTMVTKTMVAGDGRRVDGRRVDGRDGWWLNTALRPTHESQIERPEDQHDPGVDHQARPEVVAK
jgi:hypothetical protein